MNFDFEYVIFGGGCFWCFEVVYQEVKGVYKVIFGYVGGIKENVNYSVVCFGIIQYVEVVQV